MTSAPLATARLVRPAYRPAPKTEFRGYTEILEEDLGKALDEAERLKASLQKSQAALMSASKQIRRQNETIEQLRDTSTPAPAKETIARLKQTIAALRQTIVSNRQIDEAAPVPRFTVGRLTLDPSVCALVFDGDEAPLSSSEIQILICLMERPGAAISTETLIERMQRQHSRFSIRSSIHRLRIKLEKLGAGGYLQSCGVRGMGGYAVREPERKEQAS